MAELRSQGTDRSPSSYSGAESNLREKIEALVNMMGPEAVLAVKVLAGADAETRRKFLANLDPQARAAVEALEPFLDKAGGSESRSRST